MHKFKIGRVSKKKCTNTSVSWTNRNSQARIDSNDYTEPSGLHSTEPHEKNLSFVACNYLRDSRGGNDK